jgi:TorA maturation chaperone TorD
MAARTALDRTDAWADLLVVLSNCLREPDDQLVESIQTRQLHDTLAETADTLGLDAASLDPPAVASAGALTESYVALFQALETPYAPPAESPYKPWYGDRSGLMGGPAAEEMAQRYAAIEATFPAGYPPDHVSLLLEYGSLLLEADDVEAVAGFVDAHLDWIPAFRLATEGAAAAAPFHRWAVRVLDDAVAALRFRLALDPVAETRARTMVGRVADATPPD